MTPTRIVSLLPTFARPWLALSAIKQWLDQTHPLRDRHLIVGCDDDDPAAFSLARLRDAILYDNSQEAANHVHVLKLAGTLSLPEKYNRLEIQPFMPFGKLRTGFDRLGTNGCVNSIGIHSPLCKGAGC